MKKQRLSTVLIGSLNWKYVYSEFNRWNSKFLMQSISEVNSKHRLYSGEVRTANSSLPLNLGSTA